VPGERRRFCCSFVRAFVRLFVGSLVRSFVPRSFVLLFVGRWLLLLPSFRPSFLPSFVALCLLRCVFGWLIDGCCRLHSDLSFCLGSHLALAQSSSLSLSSYDVRFHLDETSGVELNGSSSPPSPLAGRWLSDFFRSLPYLLTRSFKTTLRCSCCFFLLLVTLLCEENYHYWWLFLLRGRFSNSSRFRDSAARARVARRSATWRTPVARSPNSRCVSAAK